MTTDAINRFTAEVVSEMGPDTYAAWLRLTDDERKLVAAQIYFFFQNIKDIRTRKKLDAFASTTGKGR